MGRRPTAIVLVLASLVSAAGCGDEGISERELADAKRQAFAAGRAAGHADGARAERRKARAESADARAAGFERGVDYVLHGLAVQPGQDYAIAFARGERGFFVRDSLPMKPGLTYECPPQSPYCTVSESGSDVPAATSEPAPSDPCDPSYPNVCLDPRAVDYDCAGSGDDGPEFVEGPVRILGSDPFRLDEADADGLGCETG